MKSNFLHQVIDNIFSNSNIFNRFRNIIHNNFKDEKKIIKSYLKENKKTLDFGCGAGQFSNLFDSKEYYGVDTDQDYINFCKKNHKGNYSIIRSNPPYNFKSGYFDQVLISAVIHHLDDNTLMSILKGLKKILKEDGIILIVDHFTINKQSNLLCKVLVYLDRGKYFRNPEKLKEMFNNEFKIKNIQPFKNAIYNDYILVLSKK